jgi:hypothetical protein
MPSAFGTTLPSCELTPADVPGEQAEFGEIIGFVYTLNGYDAAGSFAQCAEIARSPNRDSIDELRATMFFHLRAMHHIGEGLDDYDEQLLRGLLARVRELVMERQGVPPDRLSHAAKKGETVSITPEAKDISFGGCNFGKLSPLQEALCPTTKVLNVTLSFEDALKFNLAVDECVRKLNSYKRSTIEGKHSALSIAIHLEKGRVTVREGKL